MCVCLCIIFLFFQLHLSTNILDSLTGTFPVKDQSSPPPKCGSPGPARWHQHMVKLYERTLTGFQSHLRTFSDPERISGLPTSDLQGISGFHTGRASNNWTTRSDRSQRANTLQQIYPCILFLYFVVHTLNSDTNTTFELLFFFCPKRRAKILIKLNIYFFSDGSALFRQQDHNFTMCH